MKHILLQEKLRININKILHYCYGKIELFRELEEIFGISEIMIVSNDESELEKCKKSFPISENLNLMHRSLTLSLNLGSIGDPDSRVENSNVVLAFDV